ncbi:MAG: ASCH domain-containing protein [Armatimonadetes bacterium]|nr:ASCH domain-containing protein [Armatimonadota bacterium]
MRIRRAVSIRQPWVELILLGRRRAEYRFRSTRIRESVYLYGGLKAADSLRGRRSLGLQPGDLPTGAILGAVEVVNCIWSDREGCYAYRLRNPQRPRRPLYPKNQAQPVFWRPEC